MRAIDLILKKRNGASFTQEEIEYLINGYTQGEIPDYQMAALCMAVYFKGMSKEETTWLALAMARSGETVDLSPIPGVKVDKHSTGGVADTTTLVLGPLVAATGIPMAKMAGRGLGHTGGTIDKLESIPGLRTNLDRNAFLRQVREIGLAVTGQSENLVPADKKLYALRDVTGTVESIPLIASSIMSKKIAAGADKILLDVKTGKGAFMEDPQRAFLLAEAMVAIGNQAGRETIALVTDMNEPLGSAIGNALEVEEAILTLQGRSRGRLLELCLLLGSYIFRLAARSQDLQEARDELSHLVFSGAAISKFTQMVQAQGGDPQVAKNLSLLPQAKYKKLIPAWEEGYLAEINPRFLGLAAMMLGAGREKKDSPVDPAVGLKLHIRRGEKIARGEPLLTIHYNETQRLAEVEEIVRDSFQFSPYPVEERPLVYGVVTSQGRE